MGVFRVKQEKYMKHILVIEDEHRMAMTLREGLEQAGFKVEIVSTGVLARLSDLTEYDAVILDWMLPGFSGIDILHYWRTEKKYKTPVLMLTAKNELQNRVAGLNTGADDYMSKFFEWPELVARIHALLRRNQVSFTVGTVYFDDSSQQFYEKNQAVHLSPKEFQLLKYFFDHPTRLITRDHLISWLYRDEEPDSNVLERHIHAIRHKFFYEIIHTVRGIGYRLNTTKSV